MALIATTSRTKPGRRRVGVEGGGRGAGALLGWRSE